MPRNRSGTEIVDNRARRRIRRRTASLTSMMERDEGATMVTWVLTDEPDALVAKAIEIVEARLGSEAEDIMWLSPGPLAEPVQE